MHKNLESTGILSFCLLTSITLDDCLESGVSNFDDLQLARLLTLPALAAANLLFSESVTQKTYGLYFQVFFCKTGAYLGIPQQK